MNPYDLLEPVEKMALTIATAQIRRGEQPPPNTSLCLMLALARLVGRPIDADA